MPLSEVRVKIDKIDRQLKELFCERMKLSEQVVQVKVKTGDVIFKPDREVFMVANLTKDVEPEIRQEYAAFIRKIIEVSRKFQYGRMMRLNADRGIAGEACKLIGEAVKKFAVTGEHEKLTVKFSLPDQAGALASALAIIENFEVNISNFYTREAAGEVANEVTEAIIEEMIPETKSKLEFYAELDANLLEEKTQVMIFQLMCETLAFQLLESR